LRATVCVISTADFLTKIEGIGSHGAHIKRYLPFIQLQTALGVPVVLEQKTTILGKYLYVLASLKDSPGLDEAEETHRRGGEEHPIHEQNTTVNVASIGNLRPPHVWTKTFGFLHRLTTHQRCVVFCTSATRTRKRSTGNPPATKAPSVTLWRRRARYPAHRTRARCSDHGPDNRRGGLHAAPRPGR
jgi:hypothetical protein